MKKTATTIRCVPRFGYDDTPMRMIDLDVACQDDENELLQALRFWFASRGVADAVYDLAVDNNGFFAIVNDEAFAQNWGKPIF